MATQGFNIKINGIIGFAFMVMVFVIFIVVAKALFKFSMILAGVLLILALLINYKTVLGYLKFIVSLFKRNVFGGIIGVVLSVIGFPVLAAVLFGKSLLDRKVKKLSTAYQAQKEGEFVEYEEVVKPKRETKLDLPPMEKQAPGKKDNQYEDLF
jgi:hypothetical protein